MLASPPDSFEGPLSTYVDLHIVPNFPAADRLAAWIDAMLNYYLRDHDPVLVIRGPRRGELRREQGFRCVDSDNSPGIWAYLRCHDGTVDPAQLAAVLDAGTLPVLMAIGEKDRRDWTYGKAMSPRDKDAVWALQLKHCHILAARPRGITLTGRQARIAKPMSLQSLSLPFAEGLRDGTNRVDGVVDRRGSRRERASDRVGPSPPR